MPWLATCVPWLAICVPWLTTCVPWLTTCVPWLATCVPWLATCVPCLATCMPCLATCVPRLATCVPWLATCVPWLAICVPWLAICVSWSALSMPLCSLFDSRTALHILPQAIQLNTQLLQGDSACLVSLLPSQEGGLHTTAPVCILGPGRGDVQGCDCLQQPLNAHFRCLHLQNSSSRPCDEQGGRQSSILTWNTSWL